MAAGCWPARRCLAGRRSPSAGCCWREHAALVAATGRLAELGVAILDHDAPTVYCLSCGRNQIVVSAGALAALTPGQIHAVLAHQRAHLRCRHHMMLALATGLARAFPTCRCSARHSHSSVCSPRWPPTTTTPAATAATTWPQP